MKVVQVEAVNEVVEKLVNVEFFNIVDLLVPVELLVDAELEPVVIVRPDETVGVLEFVENVAEVVLYEVVGKVTEPTELPWLVVNVSVELAEVLLCELGDVLVVRN